MGSLDSLGSVLGVHGIALRFVGLGLKRPRLTQRFFILNQKIPVSLDPK